MRAKPSRVSTVEDALHMKFKSISLSIAFGITLGLLAPALQAIQLAQNTSGDVLIFPYYTVRNGYDTTLNITNTSAYTVAVKARFREAHNGRDVFHFSLVLSPHDVWTGVVTSTPDGANAMLITRDKSCTIPRFPDLGDGTGRKGISFTNAAYTGANQDASSLTSLDRTREGHIEVISMGHSAMPVHVPGTVAYNAKHVVGVPRNCDKVLSAFDANALGDDNTQGSTRWEFDEPLNVLAGSGALINVGNGRGASQRAVTLSNFFSPNGVDDIVSGSGSAADLIFAPDDARPDLTHINPAQSLVVDDKSVSVTFVDDWSIPIDAVSAVLQSTNIINRYSTNPDTGAGTDWVVTFPTKHAYVDGVSPPRAPFTETFQAEDNGQSCDIHVPNSWDREENLTRTDDYEPGYCPYEPWFCAPAPPSKFCAETNVLSMSNSNVFGSLVSQMLNTAFHSGWVNLNLDGDDYDRDGDSVPDPDALVSVGKRIYRGLPVVGFAFTKLENGISQDNLLNYGFRWDHQYTRNISRD